VKASRIVRFVYRSLNVNFKGIIEIEYKTLARYQLEFATQTQTNTQIDNIKSNDKPIRCTPHHILFQGQLHDRGALKPTI